MLIVRSSLSHADGQSRVFVTDANTGENVSGIADIAVSDQIIAAARSNNPKFTLDHVRNLLGIKEQKDIDEVIAQARDRHGMTILEDGSVDLGVGVTLPDAFRRMLITVTSDEDIRAVVRFGKKLAKNPLPHARESLIEWILKNPSLALTRNGNVVGYRGLLPNFTSIHAGYGIVNGVHYEKAHLDNTPGNVIEFPREMIDHNPNNHCSVGLHVGTWDYASSFSQGRTVMVTFSPTDVVSPPSDATQSKIRVSKMISRAEISSALPEDRVVYEIEDEGEIDLDNLSFDD